MFSFMWKKTLFTYPGGSNCLCDDNANSEIFGDIGRVVWQGECQGAVVSLYDDGNRRGGLFLWTSLVCGSHTVLL